MVPEPDFFGFGHGDGFTGCKTLTCGYAAAGFLRRASSASDNMIDLKGIHPEQGAAVIVQNVALEPLDTGGRELAGYPANQLVTYLAYQRTDFMGQTVGTLTIVAHGNGHTEDRLGNLCPASVPRNTASGPISTYAPGTAKPDNSVTWLYSTMVPRKLSGDGVSGCRRSTIRLMENGSLLIFRNPQ